MALERVEPVTAVLPRVRVKVLHAEASKTGLAVNITVQSCELKPLLAVSEPSAFCDRLPPAAAPELL